MSDDTVELKTTTTKHVASLTSHLPICNRNTYADTALVYSLCFPIDARTSRYGSVALMRTAAESADASHTWSLTFARGEHESHRHHPLTPPEMDGDDHIPPAHSPSNRGYLDEPSTTSRLAPTRTASSVVSDAPNLGTGLSRRTRSSPTRRTGDNES
ncbi:hypothetical protein CONLIGDRAFT_718668 [Coniochaeta ligniaria NRRL 30616]|uniref:Uncharacterized protein n=1 Tax=Coniochaeta ligniaria NRRL 30616 TaxID=1408157 RepID=A0A1J7IA39_9PEZI|nr:hypothetical protein CONLIGDRAFT_718668 [Coniochaeta ligniaria NRRL 30616]